MNKNSKNLTWSAICKLFQITKLRNSSNCREGKGRVPWGVTGRLERLPEKGKRRHADQREYRRIVGGFGGDSEGRFAGNESTLQSRNKPGNIARISRGGQVTGKIEDGGSRKAGARERDSEGEKDQTSMIMTYRYCSYFNARTSLITLWCRLTAIARKVLLSRSSDRPTDQPLNFSAFNYGVLASIHREQRDFASPRLARTGHRFEKFDSLAQPC